MGFTDYKYIAKFINGGAPPASFQQQARLQPPPDYQLDGAPKLIQNDALQKTQIYLNLPTQKEREQLQREEQERRVKGDDKPDSTLRRLQRKVERMIEVSGRAGGGISG